ncbi:MAG: hypothetical protein Tsb002_11800 [Wenzhouxiangellaceae bacterium]
MNNTIERTLELSAAPAKVWQAITDADQLAAWFPNQGCDFKAEAGYIGWFQWQLEECSGRYAMRVERVDAPRYIAWRWAREADTPIDQAYSTLVEWTLEPLTNGGTRLHLLESGFQKEEDRQQNIGGWQHELGELEALLNG